jgi:hypothetical protein
MHVAHNSVPQGLTAVCIWHSSVQALCPLEVDIDGQRTKLADAYTWQVVR